MPSNERALEEGEGEQPGVPRRVPPCILKISPWSQTTTGQRALILEGVHGLDLCNHASPILLLRPSRALYKHGHIS